MMSGVAMLTATAADAPKKQRREIVRFGIRRKNGCAPYRNDTTAWGENQWGTSKNPLSFSWGHGHISKS